MSSRDNYYSSSRRTDGSEVKREERLPSIHHMVGGDPFAKRKHSAYDLQDVKRSLPQVSHDQYSEQYGYSKRDLTLPPIQSSHASHSSYQTHHSSTPSHYKSSHHDPTSRSRMDYPSSTSNGTFQALYTTRGELVTLSTSSRPQGILRVSDVPDEGDYDPKKRHKCSECGKRFDRPSGLDQHRLRHTGERPHPCPISGCDSTFTIRSNMTRHVRTQHHREPDDVDRYEEPSHYSSTSRGSSDKSSPPSGAYYSTSRRK